MQQILATVKFKADAPKDGGYGPSINVPFTVPGFDKPVRVYCKVDAPEYNYMASLQPAQQVTLIEDKGKYKVLLPAGYAQQAPARPAQPNPLTDPNGPTQPAPRQADPQRAAMLQAVAQVAQAGQQALANVQPSALAMQIKTYLAIYQTLRENLPLVDDAVLVQAVNCIFNKEL